MTPLQVHRIRLHQGPTVGYRTTCRACGWVGHYPRWGDAMQWADLHGRNCPDVRRMMDGVS